MKSGRHGGDGVAVVSSTSITATTAAHAAGAVNVVVTNSGGQSGTLTNGYTYNARDRAGRSVSCKGKSATADVGELGGGDVSGGADGGEPEHGGGGVE